jgi:SAM-dependent methyltransferase
MRWQLQYARSLALASLPFQSQLRALKRRISGIEGDAANEPGCIEDGLRLIEMIGRDRIRGAVVLELGSGWQPLIPLLFKEAGAAKVIMTDDKALMDGAYFDRAKALLVKQGHAVRAEFSEFDYLAPCDWSEIADASVDVIWSRACLEHIPPGILRKILRQFRRILKPGGVMAHIVDNSDHWEHKDKSISRVNFLKFGDLTWNAINFHPLFYQNRLRHSDYLTMLQNMGFDVTSQESEICERARVALGDLSLDRRFRGYQRDDLAAITSRIVARPGAVPVAESRRRVAAA